MVQVRIAVGVAASLRTLLDHAAVAIDPMTRSGARLAVQTER